MDTGTPQDTPERPLVTIVELDDESKRTMPLADAVKLRDRLDAEIAERQERSGK